MLYVDFMAGEKEYKLRLNTRNVITLEKTLNGNPLSIFGKGDRIPSITEMVAILHASLQTYHHGIGMNEAYDVFDAYLADGNTATEFIPVIVEIYKISGIIQNDKEQDGKNV